MSSDRIAKSTHNAIVASLRDQIAQLKDKVEDLERRRQDAANAERGEVETLRIQLEGARNAHAEAKRHAMQLDHQLAIVRTAVLVQYHAAGVPAWTVSPPQNAQ